MSAKGTRAIDVVRRAAVVHSIHEYEAEPAAARDRDGRPSFGRGAAEALGVAPERVFKTLIAAVDGRLVVAIVPVTGELDLKRLAEAFEGRRAEMAEPTEAERATGYVVGGISPLGGRRALPTVLDESAERHPTIFVSAGRRGLQVELTPADLVRLAGARVAVIARSR